MITLLEPEKMRKDIIKRLQISIDTLKALSSAESE